MPTPPDERRLGCAPVMLVVLLIALAYPLSYPAFVTRDSDETTPCFGPIEWLIDNTPLRTPMLKWASIWGHERVEEIESKALFRKIRRIEYDFGYR